MSSSDRTPDRSLEEIEGDPWGDPPADAGAMITRVHALRRRAVGSLDTEDRRLLLSQRVGLPTLVPLALAGTVDEQDP